MYEKPSSYILDEDRALLRMVLSEIGVRERQLVRWLAEMEAINRGILDQLHQSWMDRHQPAMAAHYGITHPNVARNMAWKHVPLRACMMPELIGLDRLPTPPEWFRTYADETVSLSLGFPTAPAMPGGDPNSPFDRNSLLSYFPCFSAEQCCLPDEHWFDAAVADEATVRIESPHLFWLCREVMGRLDPATFDRPPDVFLASLETPEGLRPSRKLITALRARLAAPDGARDLAFARNFAREDGVLQRSGDMHWAYHHPPLYRACVLSAFASFVAQMVRRVNSVPTVADAILRFPLRFSSRMVIGGGHRPGLMRFGAEDRRTGNKKHFISSQPDVLRGCLWMIVAAGDPADLDWLLPNVEEAMAREQVLRFNRLVRTVGLIGTVAAVRSLARVRRRVRHAVMLGQLDAALADAAATIGLHTAEAEEFAAFDYGLDRDHRRREVLADDVVAVLELSGTMAPVLRYETATGAALPRLPAAVRLSGASTLRSLRSDVRSLTTDLTVHRFRLERSWLTGQSWRMDAFTERWLDHPVLGWLARRQVWLVAEPGGTPYTCLFAPDGQVLDPDGVPTPPPSPSAVLRLWHPMQDPDGALCGRWRHALDRLGIMQMIRQAWREVYVLTQAERETSPDSRRFAGHVLHQAQAVELGRQRGWRVRTLSTHLPSPDAPAWALAIPAFGLTAEWRTGGVGINDLPHATPVFSHVVTDRLRFTVLMDHGDWRCDGARNLATTERPVSLGEVDPIVFSEVMRDLDLLVSVATTTLDLGPDDVRPVPDLGAWRRQEGLADVPLPAEPHFGGLARTRRGVIETVLHRLGPPGSVELFARHALVHGRLRRYQIHLGSGDVLVLPQRAQLLLPSRAPSVPPRFPLPFHDDPRLGVILERIAILVRDDRIRDQTVLDQLATLAMSVSVRRPSGTSSSGVNS